MKKIILTLLVIFALVAPPAFAGGGRHGWNGNWNGGCGGGWGCGNNNAALAATAALAAASVIGSSFGSFSYNTGPGFASGSCFGAGCRGGGSPVFVGPSGPPVVWGQPGWPMNPPGAYTSVCVPGGACFPTGR